MFLIEATCLWYFLVIAVQTKANFTCWCLAMKNRDILAAWTITTTILKCKVPTDSGTLLAEPRKSELWSAEHSESCLSLRIGPESLQVEIHSSGPEWSVNVLIPTAYTKNACPHKGWEWFSGEYTVVEVGMEEVITTNRLFVWKFCGDGEQWWGGLLLHFSVTTETKCVNTISVCWIVKSYCMAKFYIIFRRAYLQCSQLWGHMGMC